MQLQFSVCRFDVVPHGLPLVGRQTVEDQDQGLPATMHQDFEHPDEQSRVHPPLVGREPEAASGIGSLSRRDRLSRARHAYDRGLSSHAPCRSLHHIGAESGFIPEINIAASLFGPSCNAWIGVAFPCFNCSRVTLVSALQWLLRRQSQLRQKLADSRHAQVGPELVRNQLAHHQPRPQTKIETMLARIFAVDPAEQLLLLLGRETPRPARTLPRTQRTQAAPFTPRFSQPPINHRTSEPVGSDHHARPLALPHALNRHHPDLFQRVVIKRSPIALHDESYVSRNTKATKM